MHAPNWFLLCPSHAPPQTLLSCDFLLSVADHTWIKIEKLGISDHSHETAELPEKFGCLKKTHGNFSLTEIIIY